MPRFRKKPVIIEAVQYWPDSTVPGVCVGPCARNDYEGRCDPHVHTVHQGGTQTVPLEWGDWVLPELDGVHFYPCKAEIFAATYEPVEEPDHDCDVP